MTDLDRWTEAKSLLGISFIAGRAGRAVRRNRRDIYTYIMINYLGSALEYSQHLKIHGARQNHRGYEAYSLVSNVLKKNLEKIKDIPPEKRAEFIDNYVAKIKKTLEKIDMGEMLREEEMKTAEEFLDALYDEARYTAHSLLD